MRILHLILGITGLVLVGVALVEMASGVSDFWTECLGSVAVGAGSVTLLMAARKGYRGHWPFVMGTVSLVLALFLVGCEVDDLLAGRSRAEASNVIPMALLFVCGILLLSSGHKLHRCLAEMDELRRRVGTMDSGNPGPGSMPNGGPVTNQGDSALPGESRSVG